MARMTVAVWVMIDSEGAYATGTDADGAVERYDDDVGGSSARRLVCLSVDVPLPLPLTATVVVPDSADEVTASAG